MHHRPRQRGPARGDRRARFVGPRALATFWLALFIAGCPSDPPADDDTALDDDDSSPADDDDTTDPARWAGTVTARVVDPDGVALEGVFVLQGGAPPGAWSTTDADGVAVVDVTDDGITDRWLLAGAEGWTTGGVDLDEHDAPPGTLEIVLIELPEPARDNPDYHFQPGGTSMSMDTSECGHCHKTIADDWVASPHHEAASNERTWDVYVGGTDLDAGACDALGGWLDEGQEPGVSGGVIQRCYVGEGLLPFLHGGCGSEGQPACDHPDQPLEVFGSCGDCHTPAQDGIEPGSLDLARATGLAFEEGVSCDLCHKTRTVWTNTAPGRDGAIELQRPSESTTVFSQEFDPITFGPYPDVVIAIMKGSYAPNMRNAQWCSGCHEYARGALRPDQQVDPQRWPGGLPIHETWSEFAASPYADTGATCQRCHMGILREESSTYDITPQGLQPSVDQGWLRETGEVHHHHFRYGIDAPPLDLDLTVEQIGDRVRATVAVTNLSAGHALPTGEPMRQLLVLVEAVDEDGARVGAIGGRTLPDVGGYLVRGIVGEDVSLDGAALRFDGAELPDAVTARFVRPTGSWADYGGPGTDSFDGRTPEQKGLPLDELIAERPVAAVAGDTATLASPVDGLQQGDVVYLAGASDRAGAPGWLFAKVLTDADGRRDVPHYRALDIASDNRLAPGATVHTEHWLPTLAPFEELTVTARLIRREHAAAVAAIYGWAVDDEEIATVSAELTVIDH